MQSNCVSLTCLDIEPEAALAWGSLDAAGGEAELAERAAADGQDLKAHGLYRSLGLDLRDDALFLRLPAGPTTFAPPTSAAKAEEDEDEQEGRRPMGPPEEQDGNRDFEGFE